MKTMSCDVVLESMALKLPLLKVNENEQGRSVNLSSLAELSIF